MGKGKLAKFADMATYPNVVECPYLDTTDSPFALRGKWAGSFFHNSAPIVLELGCGRGEYTVSLARIYPDKNFIGVDIKGARMWSGATQAIRENISNAGFLRTRIEIIDRLFASDEVSEIWLTFCDPQMKKATKRLTSTFFLERYRHFLIDNGTIHLKTDSEFLFTYTKHVIQRNNLPLDLSTPDLYASGWESDIFSIRTYYEEQWLNRGMKIKYLRFRLPHSVKLEEPNVEIELDDYRSYNRSKRSNLMTSK